MAKRILKVSPISAGADSDLLSAKVELSRRFLLDRPRGPQGTTLFSTPVTPEPKVNVVGVGVGEKISEGKPTGILAVKFFVRNKIPGAHLSSADALPTSVDGLPTDVEETGLLLPLARKRSTVPPQPESPNPRRRHRPAQPGCSVGFRFSDHPLQKMAGTFGALVRDDGAIYMLSNNHVLADENRLATGSPIYQAGLLDGGRPNRDQIAELTRFVSLDVDGTNTADAAVARVLNHQDVLRDILFIGPPAGVATARIDMIVHKFGRTTDYTVGRIVSVNTDVSIAYAIGSLVFLEQIVVRSLNNRPFSRAGDSGSLILERQSKNAVGLLFAGSDSHTIVNHVQVVLDALNVHLA